MGKSDIEIAVLRHRRARIRELRHRQILNDADDLQPEIANSMSPNIYRVATEGNIEDYRVLLVPDNEVPVLTEVTPQGNTFLHLAAIYGHLQLLDPIITHEQNVLQNGNLLDNDYQLLLLRTNSNGDLPLHVAAFAGHGLVVDALIQYLQGLEVGDVWLVQNIKGNTALHLALKANHQDVALQLVQVDQRVSFIPNEERESPLYMAAKVGNYSLVTQMLLGHVHFQGKSVVHAAIKSRNIEILSLLVENYPNLINLRDEERRSLLSYAASSGYDEAVNFLLENHGNTAYVRDPDGFFPIHSACRKGHLGALRAILQSRPDTIELLNRQGQNILHTAAECGKKDIVKYILRNERYGHLINQKDCNGNTPLHLATMFWFPKIVHTLTRDVRVNLSELNNCKFTALDAAEECMDLNPTFRERLTWMALVGAGTPRALSLMPPNPILTPEPQAPGPPAPAPQAHGPQAPGPQADGAQAPGPQAYGPHVGIIRANEMPTAKKYKDRVNTLLLLAILVATVAFSAAFTVTGVPKESKHWYKPVALQVFWVSNAVAVFSAVLTTVALIWAQLGDLVLILNVFKFVLPLLGISLISMSVAFLAGMFVVVGNQVWLPVLLAASGGIFLVMLLLLVVPFVCPYTSSQPLFRYVLRYPFCLLMLTVWNDTDDELE